MRVIYLMLLCFTCSVLPTKFKKLILIDEFYRIIANLLKKTSVIACNFLSKLLYRHFGESTILSLINKYYNLGADIFLKLKFSLLNIELSDRDLANLKKRQLLLLEYICLKTFRLDIVLYSIVIFISLVGFLNLAAPLIAFVASQYFMYTDSTALDLYNFYSSFGDLLVSVPDGTYVTLVSLMIFAYQYLVFILDFIVSLILTGDLTESFLVNEYNLNSLNLKISQKDIWVFGVLTQNTLWGAISICFDSPNLFLLKFIVILLVVKSIHVAVRLLKLCKSFLSDVYTSNNTSEVYMFSSLDNTLFNLSLFVLVSVFYFFMTQTMWMFYFEETSADYLALFYCFTFVNLDLLFNPAFLFLNPIGYFFGLFSWFILLFKCSLLFLKELDLTSMWSYYHIATESINWRSSFIFFQKGSVISFYDNANAVFSGPWFLKFGYLFVITTLTSLFALTYLGMYGVFLINLISLAMFWASSIFFLWKIIFFKKIYTVCLGKWFTLNGTYDVKFELYIDYISISFISLTLSIALFVYIYCFSYFRYEPNVDRLILFINLFVMSMVLLVSSGNLIVMYLGWELIGLTSFFLINFWSTKISALKAAFKAFTFNKVSDVSILISILLLFSLLNDTNIAVVNMEIPYYLDAKINLIGYNASYIEVISFFLLSAAFIKSAQFGFHIWLPDSMEAPVPASALIHSATLVSAGVFLLLRLSPIFECSSFAYYIIPTVGAITAAFGGVCAAYQSDIKRILAYSTISHCGFLFVSYSTGYIEYTLIYLYVHGFFKAAVFLCVGNIIRFSKNYQDFRRMGGYYKYLPFECICSFICLMNLSGLPFTLGFFIKHTLILGLPDILSGVIYVCITVGALSGVVYSFRLFYSVFFDFKKAKKVVYLEPCQISLKSRFYSNTSLASTISILGLILTSYVIIVFFYGILLGSVSNKSEVNHIMYVVSSQLNFYLPTGSFYKNIFFINFLVILTALLVFLIKWRKTYNYSYFLGQFWFYVNVIIYLFFIISLIV